MNRRGALTRLAACGGLTVLAPVTAGTARAQAPAPADQNQGGPLPAVGSPLKLPALTLLDGTAFQPAEADGRVTVVYWWASWCPFCALTSPLMDRLWREQQPRGLKFLGLSIDKRAEEAQAYLAKRGYRFPSGWVTPEVARALPRPKGLPVTLVRGRDGKVAQAIAGQLLAEDVAEIAALV